ncbi:unnamed protein product [Rotaria sp. Silwood1]|nr:unnamed protein product [Rotaria sp. Silwood1]
MFGFTDASSFGIKNVKHNITLLKVAGYGCGWLDTIIDYQQHLTSEDDDNDELQLRNHCEMMDLMDRVSDEALKRQEIVVIILLLHENRQKELEFIRQICLNKMQEKWKTEDNNSIRLVEQCE